VSTKQPKSKAPKTGYYTTPPEKTEKTTVTDSSWQWGASSKQPKAKAKAPKQAKPATRPKSGAYVKTHRKEKNKFDTDQATPAEISEAAKNLAKKRYEIEDGVTQIFQIKERVDATVRVEALAAPIKLLQVNTYTPEVGVMPMHFGPAPASGIPFASIIIEVSPNEFEKIRANKLKLPEGWSIGDPFPKPSGAEGT
jgi:hypothetical protein